MTRRLKIISCCINFPTQNDPTKGLFVKRRLESVSRLADLRMLNPQPFFPVLRNRRDDAPLPDCIFSADIRRMFYLPGVAKQLDGWWLQRCLSRWLDSLPTDAVKDAIIDAHFGYPDGVGCYRVARERKLPLFITVRGLETELMNVPAIKSQMLESFEYARGIIAVSDSLKQTLVENGVPSEKIRVIANGVDGVIYSPGERAVARKKLGVDEDLKILVSVGNVQRRKGYDILLEAVESFRTMDRFLAVIIGGTSEASMMDFLRTRTKETGLEKKIWFLGAKTPDVVVDWLRAADTFVLPTRREGCCNAVLEALSTGTPVISTPAGDNTKFVTNGFNGFLVPHEDPASLNQAIKRSWTHDWNSDQIAASVRPYTWEGVAENVVAYFNECLFS